MGFLSRSLTPELDAEDALEAETPGACDEPEFFEESS